MQNELLHVSKYLSQFGHQFVLAPIIRFKDKTYYAKVISKLSESNQNTTVVPVYLKSANSNFSNLLNPNTAARDFLSIKKVIKSSKPDVVVCFYISHAYPLALLKKFFNFSLCTVAMGSDINLENSFLQKTVRKFIYRNCDLIFARSWRLKAKIEKEYPCNVVVSPSSTDTSFFKPLTPKSKLREKWDIKPDDYVVLTVCRLDRYKGVDVLLGAIEKLQNNRLRVLVVGDGEERKALKQFSTELGISNNVVFLGSRNREDLLELYNLSDIFVLASYSEGLPRVILEAMACGCLPIATNVGSISAVIVNGYNGFTTETGDPSGLSEKVRNVLSLPEEKLKLMQIRARQSVEDFDSKKVYKAMVETLSALHS